MNGTLMDIRNRRSTRIFLQEQIKDEELQEILVSGDESNYYATVDCAVATENMLIAAESLKIGSCWIGFIAHLLNSEDGKSYVKELGIPEGFKQFHAVALGYKRVNKVNAPARKENTVNYIKSGEHKPL